MNKRRPSPLFALSVLPALAGCAMAMPPNNSTAEGRVYYACDFAVVERVMDVDGVFDQIQQRERQRWECIRAGGPVAAAPAPSPAAAPMAAPPAAVAPAVATPTPEPAALPQPTPGVGPAGRPARQARTQPAPVPLNPNIPPPPPIGGN